MNGNEKFIIAFCIFVAVMGGGQSYFSYLKEQQRIEVLKITCAKDN